MVGIIVITYNQPEFVLKHYDHLKKFCTDRYELIIVDNSTDKEAIKAIQYYTGRLHIKYVKTDAKTTDASQSHAFAASFAYSRYKNSYDKIMFLDHDCFLVKPFSPNKVLSNHVMAGLPQVREDKTYYWPGCFLFRTTVDIDFKMIPGLDTGGGTYKAIEQHKDQCLFFDEAYCHNIEFSKSQYDFYALIHDGTFLHFINGSNWAGSEANEERLNSLYNVLSGYLDKT
jgi:glycosyltransferase involved in cell wall biosynthesis